jgi:prephenate dehydrogenase
LPLEWSRVNPETRPVRWNKITLVGVGLLGGSLGMALRMRRLAGSVVGLVRRVASVRQCVNAGAVDVATCHVEHALEGSELVVLCTPIAQMRPLAERMIPHLERGTIVTDVGSVKGPVARELEPLLGRAGAHFVGSHPMAGSETSGVAAARPDLFAGAVCVITPGKRSNPAAVRKVRRLWKSVGCRLLQLSPGAHDELVSRSSHLPHVLAAQLASYVLAPAFPPVQAELCATGFRDTTRIASGSPEMWRDIVLANRGCLLKSLAAYTRELAKFRRALVNRNAPFLMRLLEEAKQRRDGWAQPIPKLPSE